jgi:hypothetical protein
MSFIMDDSFGNCQDDKIGSNGKESVIMQEQTSHDTVGDVGKRVAVVLFLTDKKRLGFNRESKEIGLERGKNEKCHISRPDPLLMFITR